MWRSRLWWRRLTAGLSGGLVLAIGVMSSLAAEDGHSFAEGSFSAGRFDLQGSADGVVFTDGSQHSTALSLPMPSDGLSPRDEVYVPFALRLGRGSDYAARVSVGLLSQSAGGGRTLVYQTPRFGCAGRADVAAARLLGTSAESGVDAEFVVSQPTADADGEAVILCLVFVAGADLVQGSRGEITWSFRGESVTA
ncbi:MAG: hypothetical protein LWW77_01020 [Propionibacteriales bacterium]|jgi:hypothetical protein|nr:hypothetical protein [Propionibacteriales bacterium]